MSVQGSGNSTAGWAGQGGGQEQSQEVRAEIHTHSHYYLVSQVSPKKVLHVVAERDCAVGRVAG